jgi:Holliday junction resolvase
MSVKAKGINAERELIHLFWSKDWAAIRVAGSGSSKYPSPDVLASNSSRRLAIEAKITKEKYRHFDAEKINDLKIFAEKFGAEPWIAIRFMRSSWFFLKLEDLHSSGNHYSISSELAESKGISFERLIGLL